MQCIGLTGEIHALVLFEFVDDMLDDRIVPVVATELGVAIGGENFENAITDFENRDVECSAAKVIDRDFFIGLLVEPVGQRCGGRLVDDAQHFQSRDFARRFGGVALRVVEIRWHGDHGFGDGLTEFRFRVRLQFAEHHCGDLLRRKRLRFTTGLDLNVGIAIGSRDNFIRQAFVRLGEFRELAADQAFGGVDGVFRIGDCLAFRCLTDNALARLGKCDHRGSGAGAF